VWSEWNAAKQNLGALEGWDVSESFRRGLETFKPEQLCEFRSTISNSGALLALHSLATRSSTKRNALQQLGCENAAQRDEMSVRCNFETFLMIYDGREMLYT
jgi:hypothetical protein